MLQHIRATALENHCSIPAAATGVFYQYSARQCFAVHQRFDCSNGLQPHEFTRCRFGFQLREINDKAGTHKPFQRQRCGVSCPRKEMRRRINVRSAVRRKAHRRNIRRISCGDRSRQPHDKRRISRINRRANAHFGRDVDKALFHSAHSCPEKHGSEQCLDSAGFCNFASPRRLKTGRQVHHSTVSYEGFSLHYLQNS